ENDCASPAATTRARTFLPSTVTDSQQSATGLISSLTWAAGTGGAGVTAGVADGNTGGSAAGSGAGGGTAAGPGGAVRWRASASARAAVLARYANTRPTIRMTRAATPAIASRAALR